MQTLGLDDETTYEAPKRFWRRQFQDQPTGSQRKWDWAYGVIMPVFCIYLDPFVFHGAVIGERALLGAFRPYVYLLSFVSVLSMMAWLLWRERLGGSNALFAGLFAIAGLSSLLIGVVLLPFSVLGVFVLIGALGFTPLFTSVIFFRNAVRAARAAGLDLTKRVLVYSILIGALFSGVVPYVVNTEIHKSLERIRTGDAATIKREGFKLKLVAPLIDADILGERFRDATDDMQRTEEMQAIADLYEDLSGKQVQKTGSTVYD